MNALFFGLRIVEFVERVLEFVMKVLNFALRIGRAGSIRVGRPVGLWTLKWMGEETDEKESFRTHRHRFDNDPNGGLAAIFS
ncbi:hypothetical protein [Methylocapsa palsarum]|uniref:hypothetical protein n=1 Tax=Methylocapsa palsarum TaxID=1612308 RepID=UPI001FCCE5E6|nr:hypothetical protein [Methylocapsa palsarum]